MNETEYLQAELQKAEKSTRVTLIAMVVVVVVMTIYFQWMKAELGKVLTPDSIADFVINEARGALPMMTESLENNIKDEAPNMVHYVLSTGVEHVLPLAGQAFTSNLEEQSRAIVSMGSDKATLALQGALASYKAAKDRPKKETAAELQMRLGTHLAAQLPLQMDVVAKEHVDANLAKTSETLKHINEELIVMAHTSDKGDREGELGKRLITTWWSFLDRGRPNVPNSEVDLDKKPTK